MKKTILVLICVMGALAAPGFESSASAAVFRPHRHWVPGHYAWIHHHRHWIPGHYVRR